MLTWFCHVSMHQRLSVYDIVSFSRVSALSFKISDLSREYIQLRYCNISFRAS